MIGSIIAIWSLALILGGFALRRSKGTLGEAVRLSVDQARKLALRVVLAMLFGAFVVELVPPEILENALGKGSGLKGILIASVAGAVLPGGPYVSFPIVVSLYKAGVGAPQLVALLTAWSVYAIHRSLIFEVPMMGVRFMLLRLASSIMFPPLAGIICALALNVVSIS